jgi:predicted PurR-regulated permease PerM
MPSSAAPDREHSGAAVRWLGLIGVVVVGCALKWTYPVVMPIVAAAFLVGLVYPVFRIVRERSNGALGVLAAFLVVLIGFAAFFAVSGWALAQIAQGLPQYEQDLRSAYQQIRSTLSGWGVPIGEGGGLPLGQASGAVTSVLGGAQTFVTLLLLTLAFVALGLPEAEHYGARMDRAGGVPQRLGQAVRTLGHTFRAYIGAITISALITAVLTAALGLAVGLEFALVFALLSFLMNYVPTIGSVLAIVPPTLFALVQFGVGTMPLVVFLGFTVIELAVGNYVSPKIEGRILQLAPTVVLAAVVFWGWLWGVAGALLAVPITIAIVVVCDRFDGARWVSTLLRERRDDT